MSVDPLTASYPWYTPYQFAGNKPIAAIDLDGLEEKFAFGGNRELIQATYVMTQEVVDNLDVDFIRLLVNKTYNKNTLNQVSFDDTPSQFMVNDGKTT